MIVPRYVISRPVAAARTHLLRTNFFINMMILPTYFQSMVLPVICLMLPSENKMITHTYIHTYIPSRFSCYSDLLAEKEQRSGNNVSVPNRFSDEYKIFKPERAQVRLTSCSSRIKTCVLSRAL